MKVKRAAKRYGNDGHSKSFGLRSAVVAAVARCCIHDGKSAPATSEQTSNDKEKRHRAKNTYICVFQSRTDTELHGVFIKEVCAMSGCTRRLQGVGSCGLSLENSECPPWQYYHFVPRFLTSFIISSVRGAAGRCQPIASKSPCTLSGIPQVVHLWSLSRIQKTCLSDEGHSMVTYGRIYFETATPMPHASGRSPRGGDRHGPNHTSPGAQCVWSSEMTSSIPNGVMG